ncbi:MAG: metal-dependent hydrolase [Halodesulfurarchaeum sp.]
MYRSGHYGTALLVYAPVGYLLLAWGAGDLAWAGVLLMLAAAMVPDWDQQVPLLAHRGITHSVWFALAFGGLLAIVGWHLGGVIYSSPLLLGFGFALGVLSVLAHLGADALTPMGIRPFAPVWDRSLSLSVVSASNPIANRLLFVVGSAATGAVLLGAENVSMLPT